MLIYAYGPQVNSKFCFSSCSEAKLKGEHPAVLGTHLLQRIHWWVNATFLQICSDEKQTNLHLGWPEGEEILSTFSFLSELFNANPFISEISFCFWVKLLKSNIWNAGCSPFKVVLVESDSFSRIFVALCWVEPLVALESVCVCLVEAGESRNATWGLIVISRDLSGKWIVHR